MSEPADIDPLYRDDCLDIGDARRRLDQGDDQRALVRLLLPWRQSPPA